MFDGQVGKVDLPYDIKPDHTVLPVVNPPRRIPIAIADKIKIELDRMESIGVITPITEPTDQVNSMV